MTPLANGPWLMWPACLCQSKRHRAYEYEAGTRALTHCPLRGTESSFSLADSRPTQSAQAAPTAQTGACSALD